MGAISNHTHRTGDGSLFCGTDGNVIADERNQYTYDSHGQLIRVSGADESSYAYDSRGNLLSKTEDGISVQYAYTNAQWPDQVTAVDGVELTYDQVGNLTGYGARQYNWTRGKLLESVTDEQGSYTYTYDADGYRATKVTANGKTTFDTIGGQLLAQAGPEGNLYFQYSGGTPFGFVLDDIQYYYLTNLNGDVVGIIDAQGNLLAQYVYDPWGKLLQINTTEPDNADQLAVATANPLRYRGYYYDSETGMYYLQSRYYDPDLGRFISADDFDCLTTSNFFSVNAYAYCWNSPIAFKDSEGNTPNLALAYANIKAFLVDVNGKIAEKLKAKKQKFLEKLQERVENLKAKFDEAKEKAKYYLKNPDVLASKIASRIAGHEVTVRFPALELIRGMTKLVETVVDKSENSNISSAKRAAKKVVSEVGRIISVVIVEIFTCLDLQEIAKQLHIKFEFKDLQTYMQDKVNIYRQYFDKVLPTGSKKFANQLANYISKIGIFSKRFEDFPKEIASALQALPYCTTILDATSGRYLSPVGAIIAGGVGLLINGLVDIGTEAISRLDPNFGPLLAAIYSVGSKYIYHTPDIQLKAEFIAYNWYYLLFL